MYLQNMIRYCTDVQISSICRYLKQLEKRPLETKVSAHDAIGGMTSVSLIDEIQKVVEPEDACRP